MVGPHLESMVAYLPGDQEVGKELSGLPQHVVVLPWTLLNNKRAEALFVMKGLMSQAQVRLRPAEIVTCDEEDCDELGQLIRSPELRALHADLIEALGSAGVRFGGLNRIGRNYQPFAHGATPLITEPVTITELAVVESVRSEEESAHRIAATYPLRPIVHV